MPKEAVTPLVDSTAVLLDEFKGTKNIEQRRKIIGDLLDEFADTLGAEGLEMDNETEKLFKTIAQRPNSIIRQERFDSVIKLLKGEKINLSFPEGTLYANAAVFGPNGEGLEIAFNEGRASGYGITSAIIIDPATKEGHPSLEVSKINQSQCELRDRSACRAISGVITKENIKYIVVRIPTKLVPKNYITPDEEESTYIFRTVSLESKETN